MAHRITFAGFAVIALVLQQGCATPPAEDNEACLEINRRLDGRPVVNQKYRLLLADGRVVEGITKADGLACAKNAAGTRVRIEYLYD